jgi:redox-sensitive bicupin YhaK (pirin superfamily)
MPEHVADGVLVRVLIGSAYGLNSPVQTFVATLYLDFAMQPGTNTEFMPEAEECALYCVDNGVLVDGVELPPRVLGVLEPGKAVRIEAPDGARFVAVGGAPLDGHRHMWWNFVSSSRERIEQAKADWEAQRMGQIAGETEFIPLPK